MWIKEIEWKALKESVRNLAYDRMRLERRIEQMEGSIRAHAGLDGANSIALATVVRLILDHFRLHIHIKPTVTTLATKESIQAESE